MNHLNKVQQLCTNLDEEPEFVVGEVYGMRQWFLREDSTGPNLYGYNDFAWNLDQPNQAGCTLSYWSSYGNLAVYEQVALSRYPLDYALERSIRQLFQENPNSHVAYIDLEGSDTTVAVPRHAIEGGLSIKHPWSFTRGYHEIYINGKPNPYSYQGVLRFRLKVSFPITPHDVTDPRCTCGFYAYTSPEALYDNSRGAKGSYFGIIKAWGKVTQGTKGFRAEKAQIVGLTPAMNRETISSVLKEIGASPVDIKFNSDGSGIIPYNNGGTLPGPGPVLQKWLPADTTLPAEAQLIPADFPRYSSMDEMFTAYQRLTGNDH